MIVSGSIEWCSWVSQWIVSSVTAGSETYCIRVCGSHWLHQTWHTEFVLEVDVAKDEFLNKRGIFVLQP